jgi:hypothetical protein
MKRFNVQLSTGVPLGTPVKTEAGDRIGEVTACTPDGLCTITLNPTYAETFERALHAPAFPSSVSPRRPSRMG